MSSPALTSDPEGPEILLAGEFSTMASLWNEYLCLEVRADGIALSSRGYELLAEASKYEVETESGDVEYELPEFIDGQRVVGTEDDYIVGGDLVPHDDEAEIELAFGKFAEARAWLEDRGWGNQPGIDIAWDRIQSALAALGARP